jgi:hypothetical protein
VCRAGNFEVLVIHAARFHYHVTRARDRDFVVFRAMADHDGHDLSRYAGSQSAMDILIALIRGEHDEAGVRTDPADRPNGFDTAAVRHPHIHQGDARASAF